MRETWSFHSAGQIIFGRGAIRQLGEATKGLGAKRVLVVTDPALLRAGPVEAALASLRESSIDAELFAAGEPEPSYRAAEACLALARQSRPDVVIGVGGGSNMDLAKITATVLSHGGLPRDYVGDDKIPGSVHALVCVPTTAGTGSEVSAAAVLTDSDNLIKVGVLSNHLRPRIALVDPLLSVSCPPKVTADSGIDALTHAIEAYTAVDNATFPLPPGERTVYQGRHPIGNVLAEKAIALIGANLRRAVADGGDLDAREGMALGATLAGLAFSNVGVALVHAMEYPVGGAVHCSHGRGNGLLLPYVMRFNMPARRKEFATIARLLGEDVSDTDENQAARAIAAVEQLVHDIGIPARLSELGVNKDQLRPFAEKAFGIKRILRVNPRPVTVDEIAQIYEQAF